MSDPTAEMGRSSKPASGPFSMVPLVCPQCGYDLRGIPEFRCPECGFAYDRAAIEGLAERASLIELAALHAVVRICGWLLAAIVLHLALTWLHLSARTLLFFGVVAILLLVRSDMMRYVQTSDLLLLLGAIAASLARELLMGVSAVVAIWLFAIAWPQRSGLSHLSAQAPPARRARINTHRRVFIFELIASAIGMALILLP